MQNKKNDKWMLASNRLIQHRLSRSAEVQYLRGINLVGLSPMMWYSEGNDPSLSPCSSANLKTLA